VIVKYNDDRVLLTFDDGPTKYLPMILSILEQKQVQAGFFWQSNLITKETPWESVLSQGHLIGSHAHSHPKFIDLTYEEQFIEVQKSKQSIETLIGKSIRLFRPPYGLYNDTTHEVIQKLGLQMVLWRVASWDWKHENEMHQIIENVVENVTKGDIVLLHELPQTCKALPKIIDGIRSKGLELAFPKK
jgi:peptidoglycan/xylan/chitin deacetylase (PgdA/CDA1 family)